ncbi:MAG: peptide ABC transporter substrate-binding protein [Steroidobacteraceae bacterium]
MKAARLLIVLLLFAGCHPKSGNDHEAPVDVTTLRRGIGGEPSSLDPGVAGDTISYQVIRDLYEGLATESPEGQILPGVASSWSVDSTGTEYTFNLRHDAKWSNGMPVRAQDFVAAWRRVVDPKRASQVADFFRPIAHAAEIISGKSSPDQLGVLAVRDDLLIVRLQQPAPYFLQLLTLTASFPIFSEQAASSHSPQEWVSNGPYVLASWVPAGNLKLTKNRRYWDAGKVRIQNVEYVPTTDDNAELRQYRAGQLDITQTIPSSALPSLRKERPAELLIAPYLATAYYAINMHSNAYSANAKLRQALAMAIDRRKLQSTLLVFGQTPAYGLIPPDAWNYDRQSWPWSSASDDDRVAQARALFAAAGYSPNVPLHLRCLINEGSGIKAVAIGIASMWKETLGIDTELITEEYRVFLNSRKDTSRWDVVRLAWTADYNDAGNFLEAFRSTSPNNDAGYMNPHYDSLLDTAALTADASERKAKLEEAERVLLSDYPIIPIYFYSVKRLVKPYVKGAKPNPLNRLYSKNLYIEPN